MDTYAPHQLHAKSHLFTVRVWVEAFGDGEEEVRMQVKHVLSGETRYFREWTQMVMYLLAKLQENGFVSRQDEQPTLK